MSNDRPQDVADILEGMTTPTPNEVYEATKDYDTNYIASAAASKAHAGAGGGGSQPGTWVGPYEFTFADYDPDLGSGWDGILIDADLGTDNLLLRVAFVIDDTFTDSAALAVYAGTLAGIDAHTHTGQLSTNASDYGGAVAVAQFEFGSNTGPDVYAGLVTGVTVSQVWIDDFSAPPGAGAGRLWLEIASVTAPS